MISAGSEIKMAADDEKSERSETPGPAQSADAGAPAKAPSSEWTASDKRGPLDSAAATDVERFVPSHELDPEGGVDPSPIEDHNSASTHNVYEDAVNETVADGTPAEPPRGEAPIHTAADATPTRSFAPVAIALVAGAVIGAGSAWLVYANSGGGAEDQQKIAAISTRVDALGKQPDLRPEITKLQSELDRAQGKIADLDRKVGSTAEKAKSATQGDDLSARVAGLQSALDQLKQKTAPLVDQGGGSKIAALQDGLAGVRKQDADTQESLNSVQGGQKQLGDKVANLTIAVAGALKKADGAEQQAKGAEKQADSAHADIQGLQSQQRSLEDKLGSPALAVVADSLVQEIRAGKSYSREVDALAALKADPAKIAVLRQDAAHGVPSAQSLLLQWKPLEDTVISVASKAPNNASFGQRLEHGLFGLVSVRRADTTGGNSTVSRVGEIETDLEHGDVPGALSAWQSLPEDAKAKSSAWGALAKTSVEALGAARDLQSTAIDALAARKS